ncbi:MAG: hypothetical protein HYS09_02650 [Chloroflexi bacterium]|nr:hypothetical protein [Chloroflexota bacterium]
MARPYLVVRARIDPSIMEEFERWYQEVHLPNVMKIPGIQKAFRSNCSRQGINWATIYEFQDDSVVQEAFASAEAAQARQDWERWLPHVSELSVEVYANLGPMPPYHHWN